MRRLIAAGLLALALVANVGSTAVADTLPGCYANQACNPGTTPVDTGSQTVTRSTHTGDTLPFTGGDVAGLAVIGAGAVLAGAVVVRQTRRRRG